MEKKKVLDEPGSKGRKKRLFVDMDGTLAEFKTVDTLEQLYERGYFAKLKPQQGVLGAVKHIVKEHPEIEVYILSSVLTDSQYALEEKNAWLDWYLPEINRQHRIFPPCGKDKKDFIDGGVSERDFLLDDYTVNLHAWEPPAHGIKLLNGINHTRGTWQGDMVRFDQSVGELAEELLRRMNSGESPEMENGVQVEDKESAVIDGILNKVFTYTKSRKDAYLYLREIIYDGTDELYELSDRVLDGLQEYTEKNFPEEWERNNGRRPEPRKSILQAGWKWKHYEDGSGCLCAPGGEHYFSYDTVTREYQTSMENSSMEYRDGLPLRAFVRYAEETVMKKLLSEKKLKSEMEPAEAEKQVTHPGRSR